MQCIKTGIEWLKRMIAALTGTCIFGDAVKFINKDCRVLFGDIFIVPFLGPALGWTAMCSPGWGNLVAIDWNDLPMGREFDDNFLKNIKSPPHAQPSLPPTPCWLNIDRYIIRGHWCNDIFYVFTISHVQWELISFGIFSWDKVAIVFCLNIEFISQWFNIFNYSFTNWDKKIY